MNTQHATEAGRNGGPTETAQAGSAGAAIAAVPHFPSAAILGAAGEAMIEHEGHIYRLRRTSRGGLVLTK